ncbi:MAG TPA: hypothetical protein VFD22_02600, partial [Gemmatimonadaceae bacterium]|nr:hypothetical protein [Gemmatimonadaceae bacterium]
PVMLIAASVGLALLFINVPVLVWRASSARDDSWARSYSFIWLVTFAALAVIGRLTISAGPAATIPVAIAGVVAFLVVAIRWVRDASIKFAPGLLAASAFFSTWIAGIVWGRIYKSPLFFEMLIGTGVVHHDSVTLAALGSMLRTYHVATMGLDGLLYMAYHWGSPWLFAQLSNLTGQSVLTFYQLGYPLTMIPLFFGSVIAFAIQMSGRDLTREWLTWILFIAATIGIFPITGMDAIGVWTSNLMISESYAVAVPVALMIVATVWVFWRQRGNAVMTGNGSIADFGFLAIFLAAGLVALGYVKISFMILGAGAAGYAALRVGAWRQWPLVLIGSWILGIVAVTFQRVSLVAHREGLVPFDFLKGFVPREWWVFFVLAQLFWTLLYVVLRLRQEKAKTVGDVIGLARARRILDVEVLLAIAVAGILPGFIMHIDGGSAFYFSDIQRWIALALLITSAAALFPRIEWNQKSGLAKAAIAFVAFPFVVSTARNSVHWTTRMLRANAELRHTLYPAAERAAITPGIRSLPNLADPAKLDAGLKSSVNYNPIEGLLELDKADLAFKRTTIAFVPQSETRYWTLLKRPGACAFSGFVVPALTGIAMIDGMPAADCKLSPYYGLSLYRHRTGPQVVNAETNRALCIRVDKSRFDRVIRLHFDQAGRMSYSVLCGESR